MEGVDCQGVVMEGMGTAEDGDMQGKERNSGELAEVVVHHRTKNTAIQAELELSTADLEDPDENTNPNIPRFSERTGVTIDSSNFEAVDFFMALFTHQLLNFATVESNRYGQQYLQKNITYLDDHPKARANQLKNKPFTTADMKRFLGLVSRH